MRVAFEVARDQLLFGVLDVAFERAAGGAAQQRVEPIARRRPLRLHHQIHHRDGRRRDAQREAVERALDLGDRQEQRLGGAGRGGDDVGRSVAGAAQILVRRVEDVLVVRVRVDRAHEAFDPAEAVDDRLYRGRQAVGRARCIRDDVVRRRIVPVVVDAEHQRDVLTLGRRRDDDFLRAAGVDVRAGLGGVGEQPGRLDDDVDAEILPR